MKQKELIKALTGKRILLYGMGREGTSSLGFLQGFGKQLAALDILDEKLDKLPAVEGKVFRSLADVDPRAYDLLFKSPGVPSRQLIGWSRGKITSQLELFLRYKEGKVIGVTGTKGKSTTCALLYHLLKQAGRKALLVGNIGAPSLDFLEKTTPDTWSVYEMSSGQLETVHASPDIAVLLQQYPEHLDFHGSLEAYRTAKLQITRHQDASNICFYHSSWEPYLRTQARTCVLQDQDPPLHKLSQELLSKQICIHPNTLAVAQAVSEYLGLSQEDFLSACHSFSPLPHRLEPTRSARGIIYYDDMLATLPQATIFSLQSLSPAALITGGHNRGADYLPLAQAIRASSLKILVLQPDTGTLLYEHLSKLGLPTHMHICLAQTPEEAIEFIEKHLTPDQTCLLSPAAPSYNRFPNYEAKAAAFKKVIQAPPT